MKKIIIDKLEKCRNVFRLQGATIETDVYEMVCKGYTPDEVDRAFNLAITDSNFMFAPSKLKECLSQIRKEVKREQPAPMISKYADDKKYLDDFYDNLSEDEINKVRKKAKELMLECGVKPPTDEWQKPIIKSMYECCYKYIAIRTMYKKELVSVGLNVTGVVRSKGEYISLDKFKEILGVM